MMDDMDDILLDGTGLDLPIPFVLTSPVNAVSLDRGLEKTMERRPVLEPVLPMDLSTWREEVLGGGSMAAVTAVAPESDFNCVGHAYGPGVGGQEDVKYRVNETDIATRPGVNYMKLITNRGVTIIVRPRMRHMKVTRADVELTVAGWMVKQKALPAWDPDKHDVEEGFVDFNVGGVNTPAPVWLWKGMEQLHDKKNTWIIYL